MKLVEIDAKRKQQRTPAISISRKGVISLNKSFIDRSRPVFNQGDGLKFFWNPQDKSDLYFGFCKGGMAFREYQGRIMTNNSALCSEFIRNYGPLSEKSDTISFQVAVEPEVVDGKMVYSVITSNKL